MMVEVDRSLEVVVVVEGTLWVKKPDTPFRATDANNTPHIALPMMRGAMALLQTEQKKGKK